MLERAMRCPRHDLALGSDGTCLRCRREEQLEATAPSSASARARRRGGTALLLAAACAILGVTLWLGRARPRPAPLPTALPAAVYEAPSSPPLAALEPAAVASETAPAPSASNASTPLSRAMHTARITLYSRPDSHDSELARKWLLAGAYTFKERAVDADREARAAWMSASPAGVVPAFDIDGQAFAGFDPARLQAAIEYAGAKRLQR
jgi:hypothetical protein